MIKFLFGLLVVGYSQASLAQSAHDAFVDQLVADLHRLELQPEQIRLESPDWPKSKVDKKVRAETILTAQEAEEIFDLIRTAPGFAQNFVVNGCRERAFLYGYALEQAGVHSARIVAKITNMNPFVYKYNQGYFDAKGIWHTEDKQVKWSYHTAIAVLVYKRSWFGQITYQPMVLDPLLSRRPLEPQQWLSALIGTRQKSGYWLEYVPWHQMHEPGSTEYEHLQKQAHSDRLSFFDWMYETAVLTLKDYTKKALAQSRGQVTSDRCDPCLELAREQLIAERKLKNQAAAQMAGPNQYSSSDK